MRFVLEQSHSKDNTTPSFQVLKGIVKVFLQVFRAFNIRPHITYALKTQNNTTILEILPHPGIIIKVINKF